MKRIISTLSEDLWAQNYASTLKSHDTLMTWPTCSQLAAWKKYTSWLINSAGWWGGSERKQLVGSTYKCLSLHRLLFSYCLIVNLHVSDNSNPRKEISMEFETHESYAEKTKHLNFHWRKAYMCEYRVIKI